MKTHRTTFKLLPLALVVMLAACANDHGLKPDATLVDPGSLNTATSLAPATVSPAAWPSATWWNGLGDPQLDALIEQALRDNPSLQVTAARARQATASADAADADRSAYIGADAAVQRSRFSRVQDPLLQGDRYSTLRTAEVTFDYSFDLWGGERAAWEAAVGQARAAEVDRQAARLTLAVDVARAYSDLGHAFIAADIAQEDLKRTQQMLTLGRQRLAAGIDSQYQLQQTESLEASAQEQAVNADKELRSARIALAVLMGKGPDRANDITRPQILKPAAVAVPSLLPADLLGRRPDLVAARWRVEAASRSIEASKTRFYPNLNLTAAAGTQSILGDALFGRTSRFFNIAPAVSLPIFDGGRLRAGLAASDADYELAVAQYNKSLVGALGEVADAINRLEALGRQVEAKQHAVDVAHASYSTVTDRYGSGIGNYLDVLTIEQQLLGAQQQLASLNAQRIDVSIQLMQALGGGYQGETLASAPAPHE